MRLSLPQLETFYWIARLGSFHAAARHLNLTQPAISTRMRELESELDTRLFLRSQNRARLTPAGMTILPQAEQMMTLAANMKQIALLGGGLRGLLRLGVVETVARIALPQLLSYLSGRYPDLRVELAVDVGTWLSRRLNERELDVVVVTDPRPSDQIVMERVGMFELSWIASASHPLAGRTVGPKELRNERIFTHPKGSTTYDVIENWFRTANVKPEQLNVCNSIRTMEELVAAGLGIAMVTPALLEPEFAEGAIIKLKSKPKVPSRQLYLGCLRETWSKDISEIARRTRQLLRNANAFEEE